MNMKRCEIKRFHCSECDRDAVLIVEWMIQNGQKKIKSVSCDNPRFHDIDNWDCNWSCLSKIEEVNCL